MRGRWPVRAAAIPGERMEKRRTAILISGRGSNMAALIAAARQPDYPAEIALVVSNRPQAAGLTAAVEAGITTAIIDQGRFEKDREAFERALQSELEAQRIEIVCLAGFMRLLTPWFVTRWQGHMINVHPALLPAFKGLDTHARALKEGAREHGATVHFVVPEMDSGPIIAQDRLEVLDNDDAQSLAARVLALEHRLYPCALARVARGEIRIEDLADKQ